MKTLSANEIMIGDYVHVKLARIDLSDEIDWGYIAVNNAIIFQLDTQFIPKREMWIGKEPHQDNRYMYCYPIPLTPEILEKNGFTHDRLAEQAINKLKCEDNPCYMDSEDHRISINNCRYYMNTNNDWYVHIDTEDMCTMAMVEITYVHEFQHLLRLCNINKQIII